MGTRSLYWIKKERNEYFGSNVNQWEQRKRFCEKVRKTKSEKNKNIGRLNGRNRRMAKGGDNMREIRKGYYEDKIKSKQIGGEPASKVKMENSETNLEWIGSRYRMRLQKCERVSKEYGKENV